MRVRVRVRVRCRAALSLPYHAHYSYPAPTLGRDVFAKDASSRMGNLLFTGATAKVRLLERTLQDFYARARHQQQDGAHSPPTPHDLAAEIHNARIPSMLQVRVGVRDRVRVRVRVRARSGLYPSCCSGERSNSLRPPSPLPPSPMPRHRPRRNPRCNPRHRLRRPRRPRRRPCRRPRRRQPAKRSGPTLTLTLTIRVGPPAQPSP